MARGLRGFCALLALAFFQGLLAVAAGKPNLVLKTNAKEVRQIDDFVCPSSDGLFPTPFSCTNEYYVCTNGVPTQNKCPGTDTIFDPVTYECTSFSQASCNQNYPCIEDGIYPYPGACSSLYFVCSSGFSYTEYCPVDKVFDPLTNKCESPESASCAPKTTTTLRTTEKTTRPTTSPTTRPTTSKQTTTTEQSDVFRCPSDYGLFPNPNDCSTFYSCSAGTPYLMSCPSGLYFNPLLQICDWPDQVPSCTTTTTTTIVPTTTKPITTTEHSDVFRCPSDYGLYPNPNDCTSYYSCSNGTPYLMHCSNGLYFNPILQVCDWPDQVPSCGSKNFKEDSFLRWNIY